MRLLRQFFDLNSSICVFINSILPKKLNVDGNFAFQRDVLPHKFASGAVVYDLGGGSRPWIDAKARVSDKLRVVGLDLCLEELQDAPEGSYDEIIATDLCTFMGKGDADVVICQATMEHVHDATGAIRAIASVLRDGGKAYIFAPGRNALFAQLNRILSEQLKKKILFAAFPYAAEGHDGFKAYYDCGAPTKMIDLGKRYSLKVVVKETYWRSGYFNIFIPAYIFWRLYQGVSRLILGEDACESYAIVFETWCA
jgi:SAM-dependent methyltransferase